MDLVEPINVITMKKKWLFIFSLFLLCMGSKAQEQAEVDEIILVFKTHVDIGYTDLAKNVMKKYQTETIDKALDVVDRNRIARMAFGKDCGKLEWAKSGTVGSD